MVCDLFVGRVSLRVKPIVFEHYREYPSRDDPNRFKPTLFLPIVTKLVSLCYSIAISRIHRELDFASFLRTMYVFLKVVPYRMC